jgi:hypothetical protein
VRVTPPPEQSVFAHILGTLDDSIERNRKMNEMLEATALDIFLACFEDFNPMGSQVERRQPAGKDAERRRCPLIRLWSWSGDDSGRMGTGEDWGCATVRGRLGCSGMNRYLGYLNHVLVPSQQILQESTPM